MTFEMELRDRETQGFEKGFEQSQNSIALNMLQLKISFDLIQKFTGLSIEKIQELSKKIS